MGRARDCGQGERLRAGREIAGRARDCGQGERLRAGREIGGRARDCEPGEIVPGNHMTELCSRTSLYLLC